MSLCVRVENRRERIKRMKRKEREIYMCAGVSKGVRVCRDKELGRMANVGMVD